MVVACLTSQPARAVLRCAVLVVQEQVMALLFAELCL
jgi:hypothetical protein